MDPPRKCKRAEYKCKQNIAFIFDILKNDHTFLQWSGNLALQLL